MPWTKLVSLRRFWRIPGCTPDQSLKIIVFVPFSRFSPPAEWSKICSYWKIGCFTVRVRTFNHFNKSVHKRPKKELLEVVPFFWPRNSCSTLPTHWRRFTKSQEQSLVNSWLFCRLSRSSELTYETAWILTFVAQKLYFRFRCVQSIQDEKPGEQKLSNSSRKLWKSRNPRIVEFGYLDTGFCMFLPSRWPISSSKFYGLNWSRARSINAQAQSVDPVLLRKWSGYSNEVSIYANWYYLRSFKKQPNHVNHRRLVDFSGTNYKTTARVPVAFNDVVQNGTALIAVFTSFAAVRYATNANTFYRLFQY